VAAVIDESRCIGCTLCIEACPVDAIVGAAKLMHTVVESLCTGCELCVPPCPVDCIDIVPAGRAWADADADRSRSRFLSRNERRARLAAEEEARLAALEEARR
jgi:Na+-translocating ferredoxin:NAD+ oxidoreductase subunit B